MSTTHHTANESTMDKIKDKLHIGHKEPTTTHTTGHTTGGAYETAEGSHGPHTSRLGNAADPRIDSDRDHRANPTHGGLTNTTGTHHTGTHTGAYDSTQTGTHAGNHITGNTGTHGGLSHSTNAGPHDSNLANKIDPRVDSDLDGRGNRHGAATGGIMGTSGSHATRGSGTAQNTDGPHNSDMLNKLDPRVDSDRDASATLGGNRTNY